MLVAFSFDEGAIGALHSHPHTQVSYVAEGTFDVTVDGMTTTLGQGSSFIVAPNLVHGVVALEKGLLIDTLHAAPRRFSAGSGRVIARDATSGSPLREADRPCPPFWHVVRR